MFLKFKFSTILVQLFVDLNIIIDYTFYMTSKNVKQTVDKKYLFDIRLDLIFDCASRNLTEADIARIFNVDKSTIHRLIKKNKETFKYKYDI